MEATQKERVKEAVRAILEAELVGVTGYGAVWNTCLDLKDITDELGEALVHRAIEAGRREYGLEKGDADGKADPDGEGSEGGAGAVPGRLADLRP